MTKSGLEQTMGSFADMITLNKSSTDLRRSMETLWRSVLHLTHATTVNGLVL
jgi:hypothetical protein